MRVYVCVVGVISCLRPTADVLSEEVIMKWYKEGHSVKGKMLFLDQMKKFIEWLQNAEEGELKNMNTSFRILTANIRLTDTLRSGCL